ncbi:hypothetical protein ACWGQ5_13155 [Streptomyces sp. NPDC055722]
MNGYEAAPEGAVWTFGINGTDYQVLKLGEDSFMVQGGEWLGPVVPNAKAAMLAIMDHEETR